MAAETGTSHFFKRTRGLVRLAAPVFALVAGLALTVVGVQAMRAAEDREADLEFVTLSDAVVKDLEARLLTFQIIARTSAGLVEASDEVTRDEWLAYVGKIDPMGDWLGFRGMAYAPATRTEAGLPRVPIRFIAPSNPRNDAVVGFDFMSEPLRAQAVSAARDRDEPVFTAPLVLKNDAGRQEVSLALVAPIYRQGAVTSVAERRAAFAGVVGMGVGIRAIVDTATEAIAARGIGLILTDIGAGVKLADVESTAKPARSRHSHVAQLQIGARDWLFQFASTPTFEMGTERGRSRLVAIIGLLATLLLTGSMHYLQRLRQRAESRAQEMTRELREHRDHLQEMVATRTAELLRAKEAAEQANQAKTEFLTNMSHELRTPLHAVLAFARLGHQRAGKVPVEKLLEYFELIRNSGNHLLELVDDLLDLSKLESGNVRLAFGRVDLRERIDAVIAELAGLIEAKHLTCRVDLQLPDAGVLGDDKRIDQLLRNLVGNAIKFSPEHKTITFLLAAASLPRGRRRGDLGELPALRLVVMDEGIGIPADELETVFDKFRQSSLTASGAGGTGLGLAICREIVHAHRGIIRAHNRAEGGAAFEVLLPLAHRDKP